MDFQLSKKRAIFLAGQALFIILALSNIAAEADTHQQPNGREQLLAPTVANGSFESESVGDKKASLTSWTIEAVGVDIMSSVINKQNETRFASHGSKFLDLANGTIAQNVNGFTPNQPYVLRLDYWGHPDGGFGTLADVNVIIDGQAVRQGLFNGTLPGIHSKEENDWVVCNGFEFTPTSSTVNIRFEAADNADNGLLIDNIRIEEGSITQPTEHSFSTLTIDEDGWRRLVNWSFETPIGNYAADPENTGPDNGNPHLCGNSIPGWRVTRENTDRISGWANTPNGTKVMDVGGHGPGGMGQTIGGLIPNSTYTLEFYVARHNHWWSGLDNNGAEIYEDMVSHLWSNGEFILEIVRTGEQRAEDGFERMEVDLPSDVNGKITFEIFSMNIDKGGNNVFDGFRIIKKQDSPNVINPGNQASNEGETISLSISASDSDGDDLTFNATGLPTGLNINEDSGLISGTITASGTFESAVTVSDGIRSTSAEFDWVVNGLPAITTIGDQSSNTDQSITLYVTATDPENDTIKFSAIGLPTGLSINEDSGLISGTSTNAGDYTVEIIATDSKNGKGAITFSWAVNSVPVLAPIDDQLTAPGTSVNLEISAADPDEDSLTFSHITDLPDGLSMDANGKITGIVTKQGNSSVTVTVSDGNGGEDQETFAWSVNSLPTLISPGDQRTEQGEVVSLGLTAADPDGDTIEFAATDLPAGVSINKSSGVVFGTPSAAGSFSVVITVTDSYDGVATINFNWEVYAQTPPTGEGDHHIFLPIILN